MQKFKKKLMSAWKTIITNTALRTGLLLAVILFALALLAPVLSPYDP